MNTIVSFFWSQRSTYISVYWITGFRIMLLIMNIWFMKYCGLNPPWYSPMVRFEWFQNCTPHSTIQLSPCSYYSLIYLLFCVLDRLKQFPLFCYPYFLISSLINSVISYCPFLEAQVWSSLHLESYCFLSSLFLFLFPL